MTNKERLQTVKIGGSVFGGVLIGFTKNENEYTENRRLDDLEIKNALCLSAQYLLSKGISEITTDRGDKYVFRKEGKGE